MTDGGFGHAAENQEQGSCAKERPRDLPRPCGRSVADRSIDQPWFLPRVDRSTSVGWWTDERPRTLIRGNLSGL